MLQAQTNKQSNIASFPKASTRKAARRSTRSNGRIGRAAVAMAVESLETRRLMTYTFNKLADLSNATGTSPEAGLYVDSGGDLFGTTTSGGAHGDGSIFEIPGGTTEVLTVYSFEYPGPDHPKGGLIADSDGILYGTTNSGTIYEFDPTYDTFTSLASFSGSNGSGPEGNLYMDSSGNLYGTTTGGGANSDGAIFELPHGSTNIQLLASFGGTTNGANPTYGNVVMDSSGNLYGTAKNGGANGDGDVWELVHGSTTITDLVDFNNTTNGETPYGGLAMDSSGNLYGTTYQGGSNLAGTVFEVAAGTHAFSTLVNLSGSTGDYPQSGLFLDSSGNIFGTTSLSGPGGEGTVFEIPATSHSTLNVLADFNSPNGTGQDPLGATLAMDSNGDIFGTTNEGGQNTVGTVFELDAPVATATKAVFTTQPSNTFAAGASQTFAVSLESGSGAVDTNNTSNVTISIDTGPSGATIDGTLTEAAVNGVATFSGLTFDEAGTYTLTATSTGLTSGTSETFTVHAGNPYQLAFAQQPTGSIAAGASLGTVTVDVDDAYGNLCTTDNSDYVVLEGNSLTGTTTAQAVGGVVTFTGLSMTQAGPQTLTAEDHPLPADQQDSSSFTITPGAASKVAFTTEPSDGYAGIPLDTIEASIEDQYGNVVTTDTSDVSVELIGSAELGGTTTQAAVAGVATFSDLTISAAGTGYSLLASSSGLTTGSSTTFDIGSVAVWTGDGGDGEWNTADNWQGDAVPTSGQPVEFPALSTTGTVNVATDVNVGDIIFSGGGYTLSGPGQITTTGITDNAPGNAISSQIDISQNITINVAAASDLGLAVISDGGSNYSVDKEGGGALTFEGSSTFSGGLNVDEGSIQLASGSSLSAPITSSAGTAVYGNNAYAADYGGTGGTIVLEDQGAPGTLNCNGIYVEAGMTIDEAIGSSSAGELVASGTEINISGATLEVTQLNGATPTAGQVITLISNQTGDPVTGTFNGLPQGALFTSNGVQYQISYTANGEDDVTLTVIGPAVWTGDGGDGQWNTAANWEADSVPLTWQDVDFPDINGSTVDNVNLASDVTIIGNITMEGNYSIGGGDITVNGDITASNTADTISSQVNLTHDTTVSVGEGDSLTCAGWVYDGGSNFSVTYVGGGTVQLPDGAEITDGGGSDVQDGTFVVDGEADSAVTVDSGGTVEGNGSFDNGIIGNGGTISLGNDSDSSTYQMDVPSVTFANGTTLHEELGINGGGVETDGNLSVSGGTIDLTGANLTLGTQNGFTPSVGDVITVIANNTGSPVTGTFNGLPEGAITAFDGVHYKVSYLGGDSGHDVTLTVVNPTPTITSVMTTDITPSVRATLSILGEDPNTGNDSDLTYTWSVAHAPSGAKPVKFSENGTNAAKDASARFQKAGTYHLLCTISNSDGGTTTQMVSVTIKQVATSLRLEPHVDVISPRQTVQYSGVELDQFKHPMPTTSITYAVNTGGGSIDDTGLFTAGEDPGHVVIQMTVNGLTGTVGATVV